MPERTFRIFLSNNTEFPLIKAYDHRCHGFWTSSDWEAPEVIPPKTELGWQTESGGVMTGTEGWVKYRRGVPRIVLPGGPPPPLDLVETIYIYWDNPFFPNPIESEIATKVKCSVTLGDVTADCEPETNNGGNTFPDPPVNFEIVQTSFSNAGAQFKNDLVKMTPQILISPIIIFGTTGIIEHAEARFTFRQKGSLRQALPLGYDSSQGLSIFQQNASTTSIRAMFSL